MLPVMQSLEQKKAALKQLAALWGVESVLVTADAVPINTPMKTSVTGSPFVTPQKAIQTPVNFDKNAFYLSKDGTDGGVCQSTASANKCRARNNVNAALDRHGTLTHQAAVIHDIATVGDKSGIGVALGVVEDPDHNLAVAKEVTRNLTEIFTSDVVRHNHTNSAIEYQHTIQ